MISKRIKFNTKVDNQFYQTLNQRVQLYFSTNGLSRKANGWMLVKLAFCLTLFLGLYTLILTYPFSLASYFFLALSFGVASALLVFNIGHDALHGALFQSKKLNRLFGYSFELAGMSSFAWHLKHNLVHHIYPNVIKVDFDIDAYPIMRLSPADKLLWFHRYQHLYAPVAYMLFSLLLVFFNDFRILYNRQKMGDGKRHPYAAWIITITSKLLYVFLMLGLPVLILNLPWEQIITGFIAMHCVLSLGICLILIPSHLFEQTVYLENDHQKSAVHWAEHQLESTLDYSSESRISNFLFGGLNTNAAHHLFPKICHIHLIGITRILKQTAKDFDIPYHERSLPAAICSHFKTLKLLGKNDLFHPVK